MQSNESFVMPSLSSTRQYREPREHFPEEEVASNNAPAVNLDPAPTGNAATMHDIRSLLHLLTTMKQPVGVMPMPSSDDAPKFRGTNLRSFLEDYNMVADNAAWTDKQKCEHIFKYCTNDTRDLVRALEPRKRGNWADTMVMLREMYIGDEHAAKYTRDSLEKFVREERIITKKKEFIKYYRGFSKQLHSLREKITDEDKNRLFWKGMPETLQDDIYRRLLAADPHLDSHSPPDRRKVHELALKALDKKSFYANLMTSQGRHGGRRSRSVHRKRSSKSGKPWQDDSDDEDSASSNDERRHKRRHSSKDTESNSDSDLADSDSSDSESSDDDQPRHSRAHRKKKSSTKQALKPAKSQPSSLKKSLRPTPVPDDVKNLTNEFRRLGLGEVDLPRNAKFLNDPMYIQLVQMMQRVAREVQENRNDTQLLLDRSQNRNPDSGKFGRCFFCHLYNTHPRGILNCPEAQATVLEGHCAVRDGRLYMIDG